MTSPIGASIPTAQTAAQPRSAVGGMNSQDFMKLLVAQLRYQDPTSPTDATAFMSQTAQLTQVDTLTAMASAQRELLASALSTQASGLVGRTVEYLSGDGDRLVGTVASATFGSSPMVRIDGTDVPLASILGQRQAG